MRRNQLFIILSVLFILIITSCASTPDQSSGKSENQISEKIDLSQLPEISSLATHQKPSDNLPLLMNSEDLSTNPKETQYPRIYARTYSDANWKPEENLLDIYLFDKENNQYVAVIKNCYNQAMYQTYLRDFGDVWWIWSKDNAYYMVSSLKYLLCDENGNEYIGGGLVDISIEKIFESKGSVFDMSNPGELQDFYVFSKKQNKIIASVKNCYKNFFWKGSYGWRGAVSNAYNLVTVDQRCFLIESSDYYLCDENGYEYLNGYLVKTDYENIYESKDNLNWEPQREFTDYYIYSKKQKKIVDCIENCYTWVNSGVYGWSDGRQNMVQNACQLITSDKRCFLVESSDYIVQEKIGDEYWDVCSPDCTITVSVAKLKAGEKVTLTANNLSNRYFLVCGAIGTDKYSYRSILKCVEFKKSNSVTFRVPYGYDKIKVFYSNYENNKNGRSCFEADVDRPVSNGRIYQIPASYDKAEQYRKMALMPEMKSLANDESLESLRLSDQDAYLDEVIKRIKVLKLDDYGKVKAIHDFIANLVCYDYDNVYERVETGKNSDGKPVYEDRLREKSKVKTDYRGVLAVKKTSCSGYSQLFYEMCSRMDIVCEIVSGYARGYLWKPSDDITKSNHAWNTVLIDGAWYLIDCTWDSGSERDGVRKVEWERTWLFVSPEKFVATHFPLDSEMQMIKTPVTGDEFRKTPYLRP